MVNCWGTVLGAKVLSYRTALILGVICQSAGALAFGAEKYPVFGDLLQQWTKLEPYPRLTAYALMWIVAVPLVWQVLAVWQAVPVPAYLGTGWSDDIILAVHTNFLMCFTIPGAESSVSAAYIGTAKLFLEGCNAAPAYSYTCLVQLLSPSCNTATACMQGVLTCTQTLIVQIKTHARPGFAATSFLTSLALALLPTGQAVVPHILPACLAVCPPVCLSDDLFHAVASTVGAILVFPGASEMEFGKNTPSPPFLTGLGWALAVWTVAPTFAVCGCALLYLLLRNMMMRNEDPYTLRYG